MLHNLKKNKNIFCFLFVLVFVCMLMPSKSMAQLSVTDPLSHDGIMELINTYNKDVHHIVTCEDAEFMKWFTPGKKWIEELDTAVHETYHSYTYDQGGYDYEKKAFAEKIYAGGSTEYSLCFYDCTNTSNAVKDIPETFRYNTYVSTESPNSSNVDGFAGLMNEFSAYYWGLNIMSSLKNYIKASNDDAAMTAYALSLGNNINAYSEFKCWMLTYMIYLRDHDSKLYNTILNDPQYYGAYRDLENRFAALIKKEVDSLSSFSPYAFCRPTEIGYKYRYVNMEDYQKMMSILGKTEYIAMDVLLQKGQPQITPPVIQSGSDQNSQGNTGNSSIGTGSAATIVTVKSGTKYTDQSSGGNYVVNPDGVSVKFTKPINKKAKSIRVPDSVTVLGVKCKVTAIDAKAFKGMTKLKSVVLGENISTIGAGAFQGCKSLTKITIPANVVMIGSNAFYGCKKLKSITVKTGNLTTNNIGAKAFKGIAAKAKFYVPSGMAKAYKEIFRAKGAGKKTVCK